MGSPAARLLSSPARPAETSPKSLSRLWPGTIRSEFLQGCVLLRSQDLLELGIKSGAEILGELYGLVPSEFTARHLAVEVLYRRSECFQSIHDCRYLVFVGTDFFEPRIPAGLRVSIAFPANVSVLPHFLEQVILFGSQYDLQLGLEGIAKNAGLLPRLIYCQLA